MYTENTDINNALTAADSEARYDTAAKRIIGSKQVLSHILKATVSEFMNMSPHEIENYIEGEPMTGTVPVDPGLTNKKIGDRIFGFNSENSEINEGTVRFDIIFYVRMKNGISQIIVNVEIQRKTNVSYELLNRAIFYTCRMISSQKGRDFAGTNYSDIKPCISIWMCVNMNENSMERIHLASESILGSCCIKGRLDLINIIAVGIDKKMPGRDNKYKLHRLLYTLLSGTMSVQDKLYIIEKEYDIKPVDSIKKDVNDMCNLSQGIKEEGIEIGRTEGMAIGRTEGMADIFRSMQRNGYSIIQIAEMTSHTEEEVRHIIETKEASA